MLAALAQSSKAGSKEMLESDLRSSLRFSDVDRPWWWEWAPRPDHSTKVIPNSADVAIVGSGFAGLTAALTLARCGRDVVVLDAETPGFGASSRSGGMIGGGHVVPFRRLEKLYGQRKATAILQEGLNSYLFTASMIESERIECHFRRTGRLRVAWRPQDYELICRDIEDVRKQLDYDVSLVTKADLGKELKTDKYFGGCIYNQHGGLHPAMFQLGILDRASEAGVTVAGNARVVSIDRSGNRFVVNTVRGSVTTRDVIVATNGYTGPELRPFARRLIPVYAYMIATEAIGKSAVQDLIPNHRMVVETRWRHCYYRPSPDGERILFGARASLGRMNLDRSAAVIRKLMLEIFPDLEKVPITHSWTGQLAFAKDFLTHIGKHKGIHYALACNGSGVAMLPYAGHKAALKVMGSRDGDTAFDDHAFKPIYPTYHGLPWFRPFLNTYYRILDRFEGSS